MDESGDLGFNMRKRSSKYFVITLIATPNKKLIEKIIKKTHSTLRKKIKRLSGGILHATKEKPVTKKRLLNRLIKTNCSIMTIFVNKERVYTKLQNEKHVFYNYVTNILIDRILRKKLIKVVEKVTLVASKRETNSFLNRNFISYLTSQTQRNYKIDIQIKIRTPSQEKGLQVADFVSWSIFRKLEFRDDTYYKIVKKRIIEENALFIS